MKTIVFSIPDDYAESMNKSSGAFYLDVFGNVRDSETTKAIGMWVESDEVAFA